MTSLAEVTETRNNRDSGRELILDAAEGLFADKGFAGSSMRSVARAAQVSQALIHHHFGTKRDLYEAVKTRFVERCAAHAQLSLQPRSGESLECTLSRGVLNYAAWIKENPNFLRLNLWSQLEGDLEPMKPEGPEEDLSEQTIVFLNQLQASGTLLSDLDPSLYMILVGGIVEHWMQRRELFRNLLGREEEIEKLEARYFTQAVSVLLRGSLPTDK